MFLLKEIIKSGSYYEQSAVGLTHQSYDVCHKSHRIPQNLTESRLESTNPLHKYQSLVHHNSLEISYYTLLY